MLLVRVKRRYLDQDGVEGGSEGSRAPTTNQQVGAGGPGTAGASGRAVSDGVCGVVCGPGSVALGLGRLGVLY
jgi:hypothetical protein